MPYQGNIRGDLSVEGIVNQQKETAQADPRGGLEASIRAAVLNDMFLSGAIISPVQREVLVSKAYGEIVGEIAQLEQLEIN